MNRILITGASAGIGRETLRQLARRGDSELIVAARNTAKAEEVAQKISAETGHDRIAVMACDLASLASVRRFAGEFRARYDRLDVLINNAGCANTQRHASEDGFELTFATNHLGPFLLTNLLLPALKAAPAARVVTVASEAHRIGRIDFQDLQHDRKYRVFQAYADSKLANILFALRLARELQGTAVTSNCLHPGGVASDIWPGNNALWRLASAGLKLFLISEEKGAEPSVKLACDPALAGRSGLYFNRLKETAPSARARDRELQDKLWEVSVRLTGL